MACKRARQDIVLDISVLTGELPPRRDGRTRRKQSVPRQYLGKFIEVTECNRPGTFMVYVQENGVVRRDVNTVQDELVAQGAFKGIRDHWDVDMDDLMNENDVKDQELLADVHTVKRLKHRHSQDEFDTGEPDDTENSDDDSSDEDFVPVDDEEEEPSEEYATSDDDNSGQEDETAVEEPTEDDEDEDDDDEDDDYDSDYQE